MSRDSIRRILLSLRNWGVDPRTSLQRLRHIGRVRADRREYRVQQANSLDRGSFPMGKTMLLTGDWGSEGGQAKGHYFHQDLLVARAIFKSQPVRHVDVGSRVDGFVAHVASFREIEVIDVRPTSAQVAGIKFHQMDLMNLPRSWFESADSVSCLHALEHFGLGRYGDPVRVDGWRNGLKALQDMLVPGGTLYLSVPTGERQRVEFNAHRVFSIPFLMDVLNQNMGVQKVDFVLDDGNLIENIDLESEDASKSFGANYGCSIWTLIKG